MRIELNQYENAVLEAKKYTRSEKKMLREMMDRKQSAFKEVK